MSTLILLLTGAIAALECERAHNGINQVWHMRVTSETKIATRQRILQAAQKLFAEEGFESATTRDIARAAKIAVGTLFNYFPTKEAIVECLVSEAYAAIRSREPSRKSCLAVSPPLCGGSNLIGSIYPRSWSQRFRLWRRRGRASHFASLIWKPSFRSWRATGIRTR